MKATRGKDEGEERRRKTEKEEGRGREKEEDGEKGILRKVK